MARAFGQIAKERDDLHLILAGPDNEGYGRRVREWLASEGVLSKTTFTGMLVGEDKLCVLRDAELFVLPSYTENFGLAVVEAMASRLPIVISNKVNLWQDVAEADAGLVVDCDAERLAGAIMHLLEDPAMAKRMGERGRTLVQNKFTWEGAARQMSNVYHNLQFSGHTGQQDA